MNVFLSSLVTKKWSLPVKRGPLLPSPWNYLSRTPFLLEPPGGFLTAGISLQHQTHPAAQEGKKMLVCVMYDVREHWGINLKVKHKQHVDVSVFVATETTVKINKWLQWDNTASAWELLQSHRGAACWPFLRLAGEWFVAPACWGTCSGGGCWQKSL